MTLFPTGIPEPFRLPAEAMLTGQAPNVPDVPAVFLITTEGAPYISRSAYLRRRLSTLFRQSESKRLTLAGLAREIYYWPTGSRLESSLLLYRLTKQHFNPGSSIARTGADSYRRRLKLRPPAFVKVLLTNQYPRTQITSRIAGGASFYYGPFPSKAAAEKFEAGLLDLFPLRRCEPDLHPDPEHPGCVYGEMGKCLRPCQQVVGPEEYATEVQRALRFLETQGTSLETPLREARDRFSTELRFEAAAQAHLRLARAVEVRQMRGDLTASLESAYGVAVIPAFSTEGVNLCLFAGGRWSGPLFFDIEAGRKHPLSLDAQLRELLAEADMTLAQGEERPDGFALLARWYYSSWRDGVWLPFSSPENLPYRRLVRAVSQVAGQAKSAQTGMLEASGR